MATIKPSSSTAKEPRRGLQEVIGQNTRPVVGLTERKKVVKNFYLMKFKIPPKIFKCAYFEVKNRIKNDSSHQLNCMR